MLRGLCYADAARQLGGGQNKIVVALDQLTGGLLLAASASGSAFALSLFDAKSELVRLGGELVSSLSSRTRGITRMERSEQLAAAHAVIVVNAFFDALREVSLPFDINDLKITASEQVNIATGSTERVMAVALVRSNVPIPTPHVPYERTVTELTGYYHELAKAVSTFISGLSVWDLLDVAAQSTVLAGIADIAPGRAVAKYEDMFRRLAAEFPEVAFWSNLVDHQATRTEIRSLHISLAGMAKVLSGIATGRPPGDQRLALARAYQAALRRPLLPIDEAPDGLRFPVVDEAYVNPDFRAAEGLSTDQIANERWWAEQPRRTDLQEFLVGHLTTPRAAKAPLVVLGQPGSGKSLLTQVLAARLPASDFLAVRVMLREVAVDADLQTQIEQSIRAATGETVSWPNFARTADDALPVVLIDGFDELLQATGMSQSNYLEKITAFQRREADQGRPVVVIVTSRTSVADRVRPVEGVVTVRLEPFDDKQIGQWLAVWRDANVVALAARGLRPLPVETALAHADLACQPLLLMMLALYDNDGNPLQQQEAAFGQAELYERLLTQFARREILKIGAGLSDTQVDQAVERELLRLAVVAFAMFNRHKQWGHRGGTRRRPHSAARRWPGHIRHGGVRTTDRRPDRDRPILLRACGSGDAGCAPAADLRVPACHFRRVLDRAPGRPGARRARQIQLGAQPATGGRGLLPACVAVLRAIDDARHRGELHAQPDARAARAAGHAGARPAVAAVPRCTPTAENHLPQRIRAHEGRCAPPIRRVFRELVPPRSNDHGRGHDCRTVPGWHGAGRRLDETRHAVDLAVSNGGHAGARRIAAGLA